MGLIHVRLLLCDQANSALFTLGLLGRAKRIQSIGTTLPEDGIDASGLNNLKT